MVGQVTTIEFGLGQQRDVPLGNVDGVHHAGARPEETGPIQQFDRRAAVLLLALGQLASLLEAWMWRTRPCSSA